MVGGGVSTTVTVTYNGHSTDFQYNKETLYIKIPAHTEYTLSFGETIIDGYNSLFIVAPSPQTFTSGAYYSRTLNYTYEYSDLGVWIVDAGGNIVEVSSWTQGSNATGVAVITDQVRLIVAPDEWYTEDGTNYDGAWNGNNRSAWGGRGTTVSNIVSITSSSTAIMDLNGSYNTDQIISQLKGTAGVNYTGAPAAEYCRAYSSGCKGVGEWYLPAAGEMKVLATNKDAINAALSKISGETLGSSTNYDIWTSTQYDSNNAWYYHWTIRNFYDNNKTASGGVRPICQL